MQTRRANTSKPCIGTHVTITRVTNGPDACFAFGVTDDGEGVYIPAIVVKQEGMTEDFINAGVTCPIRSNPRVANQPDAVPWVADVPFTWDVDEERGDPLVEAVDEALRGDGGKLLLLGAVAEQIEDLCSKLMRMAGELYEMSGAVKGLRETLDEVAPENVE